MDIKESALLGPAIDQHWYYRAKAAAVQHCLRAHAPRLILDVGAGSGFFSRYLLAHGGAREAWCVDTNYAADEDSRFVGKPLHYRRSLATIPADLVLLMDVLEHVDDDRQLLGECARAVPSGARFLITVPAFQFLWSGHDVFLEHKRRYTLRELEERVNSSGLQVKSACYYFGLVFPLAASLRWLQKASSRPSPARSQLQPHHPLVNAALKTACLAEIPFMRFNRLAGLSVFCLAEKP